MAWKGSSHVEKGTGRLPCLTWVKRSSSAAASTRPSFTRHAAGSWKAALIPSVYIELPPPAPAAAPRARGAARRRRRQRQQGSQFGEAQPAGRGVRRRVHQVPDGLDQLALGGGAGEEDLAAVLPRQPAGGLGEALRRVAARRGTRPGVDHDTRQPA